MTPSADPTPRLGLDAPALAASQRQILELLKANGSCTVAFLGERTGLNIETVRHHIRALEGMGYVQRVRTMPVGRGRPEVAYGLTHAAEALFPRREGEVLRALAMHLKQTGNERLLEEFFDSYIDARRAEAHARVAGLSGSARVAEVAAILTELGFMARTTSGETTQLHLCHCPLRDLVDVSRVPCRAELRFVRELMGHGLTRLAYIPSGDPTCSYQGDAA